MFSKIIRIFRKKKKSYERDATFYDDLYRSGGHRQQYHVHYDECFYRSVWSRGADIIKTFDSPHVLDIGCGPGQFANMLYDSGVEHYKGVDHSAVAIGHAKENVPVWAENFFVADALGNDSLPEDYTLAVLFEVLEHIERDLDLVAKIKPGAKVLFSVPSFSSASHVRKFTSPRQVMKRYSPLINDIVLEIFDGCPEPGKTIYLGCGIRK